MTQQFMGNPKNWKRYQHGLEESALSDVEAAIFGQNLNVLDSVVEPAEDE